MTVMQAGCSISDRAHTANDHKSFIKQRTMSEVLAYWFLAVLALTLVFQIPVTAQDSVGQATSAKPVLTGTFHGKVHNTSGRATIYEETGGTLLLRLTNFKTSNGPDVHVILVATQDADDDANFLKSSTERVELGALKGNEGDQNYEIPAGTDLAKYQTVSVYCERFNANFGAAPLQKF
jgi:hypothetical protein